MSRNSRIIKATKLKAVHEYKQGLKRPTRISEELNVHKDAVREWSEMYDAQGEKAFDKKPRNQTYLKKTKLSAVKDYLSGQSTATEIMKTYGITNQSILRRWIRKYNGHVELKDYDPKGEVYMAKHRKTTYEERLEIVHYCLRNGRKYTHRRSARRLLRPGLSVGEEVRLTRRRRTSRP